MAFVCIEFPPSLFPADGAQIREHLRSELGGYREDEDHAHPGVYVGHFELADAATGFLAKSNPKIGCAKFLTAVARGRCQGGANWFFDGFWPAQRGEDYRDLEMGVHKWMGHDLRASTDQGQREVYGVQIKECVELVEAALENIRSGMWR